MTSDAECDRKRKPQTIPLIPGADPGDKKRPAKKKKKSTAVASKVNDSNKNSSTCGSSEHDHPEMLAKKNASQVSFMTQRSRITTPPPPPLPSSPSP